ncbi:P-II family nitrogen regulator [Fusobacterium varium]|jgi:nitrogen regulatory protein PII|uniref:P-II family nitrogen regulator n=1 Tax=Fusobacterium varium TaxID=856 RepID=UPI001F30BB25|nr:P-II family nitrogen regulator [Fusobacterium varium]MCF0170943.1 P-II family nitrogen regulator [Fusobacterium varium]MCF2671887.1 P-II family nitrogen regulator [Fusobacterium varium]UYI78623.1 MAG: P-II family nitrogen regulator [Fusobacterium varium]
MKDDFIELELELMYIIVNYGLGSKIIKYAKKFGVTGSTICLGKGTIKNSFLEFLAINESRKEIVLIAGERSIIYSVMEELNKKFSFDKPNKGVALTVSIKEAIGARGLKEINYNPEESRGAEKSMYNLIVVIVEKGNGEHVVEAANKAGSRGATIINGRGSGIHETSKLFAMDIEPEKEIVMIISQSSLTEKIVSSIRKDIKIDEPGKGVIFVQEVNKACGLY